MRWIILNSDGKPMLTFSEILDEHFFNKISDALYKQLDKQLQFPAAWIDLPCHISLDRCLRDVIRGL